MKLKLGLIIVGIYKNIVYKMILFWMNKRKDR